MGDIEMMHVEIDWGMVYLFGDATEQVVQQEVADVIEARWVIEWALAGGAESAKLIRG